MHFAGKHTKNLSVFSHNADSSENAKKSFAKGRQMAYSKEEIKKNDGFDKGVKAFPPFPRQGLLWRLFFI